MAFDAQAEARAQDTRRRSLTVAAPTRDAQMRAFKRRRARAMQRRAAKALRIAIFVAAVVVACMAWGLVAGGIGTSALLAVILASVIGAVLLTVYPRANAPEPAQMVAAPPAVLPVVAEQWLDRRRRELPALAAPQVDAIAARLATLEPQLATVAANDPVAADLNRLLGQHLPDLVERYTRVPEDQRRVAGPDGASIETRLVDGLAVVDSELARVSEQLAAGDRDAFLIQGRFLESKYGGDPLS
jgi:hypothetical protein